MLIIAAATVDSAELDQFLDRYDHAQSDEQREQIASEVYRLVGARVKAMVSRAAGAQRLPGDQIDAFAWEALIRGLNGSGISTFKRADVPYGDWTPFILKMAADTANGVSSPGSKIWRMLSATTRAAIQANPRYLKATTQDALIRELNAFLLRSEFFDPATWAGVPLPEEAEALLLRGVPNLSRTELSRLNTLAVASAFPGIAVPPKPKRNLLGLISATIVPKLKPAMYESFSGAQYDRHLQEAWAGLKTDIQTVREMEQTGTLPDEWLSLPPAGRVYQQQLRRLQRRYGVALGWWNARLQELLGSHAFQVTDTAKLRDAKLYLDDNRDKIDEKLWKNPISPYYLPTIAVRPHGVRTIERLLEEPGFGRHTAPINQVPAAPPIISQPETPELPPTLAPGDQARAYKWLVQRLFSQPGYEAEFAVGNFLSENPSPNRPQIQSFLCTLPENIAEDIETTGWHRLVSQVDSRVLEQLRDPAVQAELRQVLGSGVTACRATEAIRRFAFSRTTAYILKRAG
ncbi:MAG TPA: hypothetical protein VGP72_27015 [Planctomycetota bacterium]|jgi:hypothetical protein